MADQWRAGQRARLLLPVPYFLLTFTVPEELRLFLRAHSQIGLDLLFAASAQALQDLAANARRLGAQLGRLGVLHTWSRTLIFEPLDWMRRFLQHILPPHFARVRTFGWLHPAAKVRCNRVRALLRQPPWLSPAQEAAWHPPAQAPDPTPGPPPPGSSPTQPATRCPQPVLCPRCQQAMRRVGSWKAGQPMLFPNRPP